MTASGAANVTVLSVHQATIQWYESPVHTHTLGPTRALLSPASGASIGRSDVTITSIRITLPDRLT